MDYFNNYSSNTLAAGGNQLYFGTPLGKSVTGRAFYKINVPGRYNYSLFFTNTIDSTYADGSISRKNMLCGSWKIISARVAVCGADIFNTDIVLSADTVNKAVDGFTALTFGGSFSKTVSPGETFFTDSLPLEFGEGEYLCLELTYSGSILPYHEETLLPVFVCENGVWEYNRKMPLPGIIGCDRIVDGRIGYIGDSITQGIGTPVNSYKNWCALLSGKLSSNYAYWNLGLGFGRAEDMASDGAWAYKAKQNDTVFVCFGVNDILNGFSADKVKRSLADILRMLKESGARVVMQTVPPFDYTGNALRVWQDVNRYILCNLAGEADAVFDTVPVLGRPGSLHNAVYGGHPDPYGCALWADALYEQIKNII